jgi:hypothetical protein
MRRITYKHVLFVMALTGSLSQSVTAQSECAAANDNDDQICSVSCPLGQTATCSTGIGSSAPKCACSSASVSLDPTARQFRGTRASKTDGPWADRE